MSRLPTRTRRARLLILLMALGLALIPWASAAATYPDPLAVTGDITNIHDPSMIKLASGEYVVYSTHNNLEAHTSTNRVKWTSAGAAFATAPSWWSTYSSSSDPWAPDVSYHGGKYLMYYAVSTYGSNHSAIGLATSGTGLPDSWTDLGTVFTSTTSSAYNAIDPSLMVDGSGNWWLSFGSYWTGIWQIQIDPSTGKQLSSNTTMYHLATRPDSPYAVEGSYILHYGGYYYLFNSYDQCCAGTSSTYKIKMGRSTSPNGPFYDESGTLMLLGGGTLILASHGRYIGPGGESVLQDSEGYLLVYHYYDGDNSGTPTLGLNLLGWSNGWPYAE